MLSEALGVKTTEHLDGGSTMRFLIQRLQLYFVVQVLKSRTQSLTQSPKALLRALPALGLSTKKYIQKFSPKGNHFHLGNKLPRIPVILLTKILK